MDITLAWNNQIYDLLAMQASKNDVLREIARIRYPASYSERGSRRDALRKEGRRIREYRQNVTFDEDMVDIRMTNGLHIQLHSLSFQDYKRLVSNLEVIC